MGFQLDNAKSRPNIRSCRFLPEMFQPKTSWVILMDFFKESGNSGTISVFNPLVSNGTFLETGFGHPRFTVEEVDELKPPWNGNLYLHISYPFCHNHGSVEKNHPKWKVTIILEIHPFSTGHHDYGKGNHAKNPYIHVYIYMIYDYICIWLYVILIYSTVIIYT